MAKEILCWFGVEGLRGGGSVNERSTKATQGPPPFLCVLRLEGPLLAQSGHSAKR